MKIGIIGSGNIGRTLARHLSKANHEVSISNSRGADTLVTLATVHNLKAVSVYEAARNNDLVIIAIPQQSIRDLPKDLFTDVADDVIIVDTCNYYPLLRDGIIDELESMSSDSEWVSKVIGRSVIKAFNSIQAQSLAEEIHPKGSLNRIAIAVSGDDLAQKEIVASLLDEIGFDFYDNGPLRHSWKQQPGTPGYCMDFTKVKLKETMDGFYHEFSPEVDAYIKEQRTKQENQILAGDPMISRGYVN